MTSFATASALLNGSMRMKEVTYSRVAERAMVIGTGGLLVAYAAAVDDRARGQLTRLLSRDGLNELTAAIAPVHRFVHTAAETAGVHGSASGVFVAFGLTAIVLFVMMFRM